MHKLHTGDIPIPYRPKHVQIMRIRHLLDPRFHRLATRVPHATPAPSGSRRGPSSPNTICACRNGTYGDGVTNCRTCPTCPFRPVQRELLIDLARRMFVLSQLYLREAQPGLRNTSSGACVPCATSRCSTGEYLQGCSGTSPVCAQRAKPFMESRAETFSIMQRAQRGHMRALRAGNLLECPGHSEGVRHLPGGSYQPIAQQPCVFCPAGKFSSYERAGFLQNWGILYQCQPGTFQNRVNSTQCRFCTTGSLATGTGSTTCTSCSAGTYTNLQDNTCTQCSSGTYSGVGSSVCILCGPETFAGTAGMSACLPCAQGFTTLNSSGATACIQITTTGRTSSTDMSTSSSAYRSTSATSTAEANNLTCFPKHNRANDLHKFSLVQQGQTALTKCHWYLFEYYTSTAQREHASIGC